MREGSEGIIIRCKYTVDGPLCGFRYSSTYLISSSTQNNAVTTDVKIPALIAVVGMEYPVTMMMVMMIKQYGKFEETHTPTSTYDGTNT
mmetsp:Transcript_27330/g.30672  ORF Transcript_27330/g.30672 Transcript_27330/m.30672 type:complete len:89 (+) Transcript_27330:361-627(+)